MRLVQQSILLLHMALPAMAQDAAFWDGTGCRMVPIAGQAHVAEVICRNRVTTGNSVNYADLTIDGLNVGLMVDHRPGDIPDNFTVIVPDGYVAEPSEIEVPEHGQGSMLIYQWTGS